MLGPGFEYKKRPRPLGGRASQHVEAHSSGCAVVPRRKPAPVKALFAIPVVAAQGKDGGVGYTGVWHGEGASFGIVVGGSLWISAFDPERTLERYRLSLKSCVSTTTQTSPFSTRIQAARHLSQSHQNPPRSTRGCACNNFSHRMVQNIGQTRQDGHL
jgi:hypothetical protein